MYVPPEGKLIHDIETAWLKLEKCEHGREVALKDELIRYILIWWCVCPMPGVGYVVWSLVENLKIHLKKCTKCDRNLRNGTYLHVNIWLTWFQYDLNFKVFHPMNYLFCAILKARETWTAGKKVFPKGNYDCCMLLLLFCLQVYCVIKSNYEWLIFILLFFKWLEIQFYKYKQQ